MLKQLFAFVVVSLVAGGTALAVEYVVPFSAEWSYLNPTSDPAASDASFNDNWFTVGYDDSTWLGPAPEPFARVEGTNNRIQAFTESNRRYLRPLGTGMPLPRSGSRLTTFYRTDFTVDESSSNLALQYLVDDGARFYLDGEEIFSVKCCEDSDRVDIPLGDPIAFDSEAFSQPPSNEATYTLVQLDDLTLTPGAHTLAISVHQSSPTSNDMAMSARLIADFLSEQIILPGEEWQYFEGREEPSETPLAWADTGYDDGDWESGRGGFGYDFDDATLEDFENNVGTELADMQDGFSSVYFRRVFSVDNANELDQGRLIADYDDGFVAYLNGVEVLRSSVDDDTYPIGQAVPFEGLGDSHESTNGNGDPGEEFAFDIPKSLLQNGENVFAIHGLNTTLGSSDFFLGQLDLQLTGGGALPDFLAGPNGDVNGDGSLDATDLDLISSAVREMDSSSQFDVNGDGSVDNDDRVAWVEEIANTYIGDSNLDLVFDDQDIVSIFIEGKYLTGEAAGWAEGDWDGNGVFDNTDFVAAFIAGGYQLPPRQATAAVPEPGSWWLLALAMPPILAMRRTA